MLKLKQSPTLTQRVKCFVQQHNLFSDNSHLLLAVSGGPDSICLLHVLIGFRQELGIKIHVAHLNHQLRGAESEADAIFVEKRAASLNVPVIMAEKDVKAYQKKWRISTEEAARKVRYRFLADSANSVGADCIVTGHTLDDQVETILMHIIRGTGTKGLVGLKPYYQWHLDGSRITVIRPLLQISRQQTADYCKENELLPRLDTSNLSLSPLRNRIRQQLVPLLESYNPSVTKALLRTATVANDEITFLDIEIARIWPWVVTEKEGLIILNKNKFDQLPMAIKRHLLRTTIKHILGSLKDIEKRHVEEILALREKPAGRQIDLPGALVFATEYDRYLLGVNNVNTCPYPVIGGEYCVKIPGETVLNGWLIKTEIVKPGIMKREEDDFTSYLDLDKVGYELNIRHYKSGDYFQPLGMVQLKKLNRFMIDSKIPRSWRERIPVVFSPQQILWLVGYRIDERVKITEGTKNIIRLEFKRC